MKKINLRELYSSLYPSIDGLKNWNSFQFDFGGTRTSNEDVKSVKDEIKSKMKISSEKKTISGLYWILNEADETLYIGKGVDVADRLFSHYKASIKMDKAKKWVEFFSSITEPVWIRWLELEDENKYRGETLRIIFERLLTDYMMDATHYEQPFFEACKKKYKTVKEFYNKELPKEEKRIQTIKGT